MTEVWTPVKGFEGFYEVSDFGSVRSVPRYVNHSKSGQVLRKGVVLSPGWNTNGYKIVNLTQNGSSRVVTIHRVVAEAFLPNPENKRLIRHLNDIKVDNRLENLAWGTNSDNSYDAVRNGVHNESRKTHCPKGHPYDEENTYRQGTSRKCRTCRKNFFVDIRVNGIPEGDPRHGTKTAYSSYRCRCEVCIEENNKRKSVDFATKQG